MEAAEKGVGFDAVPNLASRDAKETQGPTQIDVPYPVRSLLQAESSFGSSIVVILIEMEYFLARPRQSTLSSAASVRTASLRIVLAKKLTAPTKTGEDRCRILLHPKLYRSAIPCLQCRQKVEWSEDKVGARLG